MDCGDKECCAHSDAWMRGALRWWGWCFDLDIGAQRGRPTLNADGYPAWMPGVHAHALALAGRGKDEQQQMVRASFIRKHLRNYKRRGQCIFLRYFNLLVEKGTHFGEISRLDCSRLALHSLCMVCYGGLPLGRTRAHFQYANQLEQAGISGNLRRCCLLLFESRCLCIRLGMAFHTSLSGQEKNSDVDYYTR